ncbi:tumor necrosis factor receptor superfamily member 18 [Leptodactylus fuscus]
MNINGLSTCCPPCRQSEKFQVCPDAEQRKEECHCNEGYGCRTKSCTTCEKLPICGRNSYLKRTEKATTVYEYYCEACPKGTYFEAESGTCEPSEEKTITESSRDRNVSSVPSTPSPKITTTENASGPSFNTWVLFFGVAVFILLIITVAIHIFIWKMKAAPPSKITGDPFQPHPMINRNTKEDMDSWSCQYPEEEHGEHGNCLGEKQNV